MVAQRELSRLEQLYRETVVPRVRERFELSNVHQLPRLSKIILNCPIGRFLENQKLKPEIRDTVVSTLSTITGQRPVAREAPKRRS